MIKHTEFFTTDKRPDESYQEYYDRIRLETNADLNLPYGTPVQFICTCGAHLLECYREEGAYRTFVRCPNCGRQGDVHTG